MVRPKATARSETWRAVMAAGRIRSIGDVTEKNLPSRGGGSRPGCGPWVVVVGWSGQLASQAHVKDGSSGYRQGPDLGELVSRQ